MEEKCGVWGMGALDDGLTVISDEQLFPDSQCNVGNLWSRPLACHVMLFSIGRFHWAEWEHGVINLVR